MDNNQKLLYIKTSFFSYPIRPFNAKYLVEFLEKRNLKNSIIHTEMGDYLDINSLEETIANEILTTLNREEDAFNTVVMNDSKDSGLLTNFYSKEKEINSYELQVKYYMTKNNFAQVLKVRIREFDAIMQVKEMIKDSENLGRGR